MLKLSDRSLLISKAFINGKWRAVQSSYALNCPYTGKEFLQMADCNAEDVREAITSLKMPPRSDSVQEHAKFLRDWHQLIQQHSEDLAQIMVQENGKPIKEARGEVQYAASFVQWFSEEVRRNYGRTIPGTSQHLLQVTHGPVGLCALITPFNFPLAMIARKMAPAVAAGNSVLIKPAAETPCSATALVELALRAGMDPQSVSIIPCSRDNVSEVGQVICESSVVNKISFTGSTEIGRKLMADSSPTLKRLSLELGGNAPFVVFPGSESYLKQSVQHLLDAKMRNAGQTCIAPNRILVHHSVTSQFTELLIERLKADYSGSSVGCGFNEEVKVGPLISKSGFEKVMNHFEDAKNNGVSVLYNGNVVSVNDGGSNQLIAPIVIDGCTQNMLVARQETFGPLISVFSFDSEQDGISMANDTEFGLAAYIMHPDTFHAQQNIVPQIESGMIGLNSGVISYAQCPFGGVKQSGFGREGGVEGLAEYQNIKYVCSGKSSTS